jgi:hypothetical protein
MSLSADVLDRAWAKVGMSVEDKKRDRFAYLRVGGKLILFTRRSYGRGKLSDHLADLIRQQMKLNEDQFGELLACPLKEDGYLAILKAKRLLE